MWLGVLYGAVFLFALYFVSTRKSDSLPPTAPGNLPILGHIVQLIKPVAPQELFRQWSLIVGPVFTLHLGAKRWVVLNSMQAVQELIVQKGNVYSSRDMPPILVHDLLGGENGGGFPFYPYGPHWRRLRRIAHTGLTKSKVNQYQNVFDRRRSILVNNLWQAVEKSDGNPIDPTPYLEHFSMTGILIVIFGSMCNFDAGDQRLHDAFQLTEDIATCFGAVEQAAEFFPLLKYILPDSKPKYKKARERLVTFYGGLVQDFRNSDQQDECLLKAIMDANDMTDLQSTEFLANIVGAASETTVSTLAWMIALLANHPDIQDQVYEEIKENVGLDRLPTAEDESKLPMLQCVIFETLRLRPPLPVAVPHATSKNDVYNGWLIPSDTTIIINIHAIHQDPALYPEPTAFQPKRHWDNVMQTNEQKPRMGISQTVNDRPHLAFSTGRRGCVGIHFAERAMFMAASALLSRFRFDRPTADLLNTTDPKDIHAPTFFPKPYNVLVVPRCDHMHEL